MEEENKITNHLDNIYYRKRVPNVPIAFCWHCSDLEKRQHKNFPEKHYAGARANIEQKPHGASLNSKNKSDVSKFVVELP